jgi:ubiquinone/menaquinone biosynthesis C-methylase UbiE
VSGMNRIHNRLCRSDDWHVRVEKQLLPWALKDVDLGDNVLEIGPGFGATTKVLARSLKTLTAVELDPKLAELLQDSVPGNVEVVVGDGTALPFPDNTYSAVLCFTMLHHIPSKALQDKLLANAFRVLRPGGVFAGSDSRLSLRFRILHIADIMVPIDPATFPDRLRAAGFEDITIDTNDRSLRFRAHKPH